jgi:DNA-directed RNA polymerase subunit RPC12/RpoP
VGVAAAVVVVVAAAVVVVVAAAAAAAASTASALPPQLAVCRCHACLAALADWCAACSNQTSRTQRQDQTLPRSRCSPECSDRILEVKPHCQVHSQRYAAIKHQNRCS